MKKIITLFVLFFAFSINASAQDKPAEFERSAKKDLELLMTVVPVENNMQMAFFNLFLKKHQDLAGPNVTEATKRDTRSIVDAKLRASLTADQAITLEKHKDVYEQLLSGTSTTATLKKK